ncbi:MAG: efflux transporter periplasmic adaptor subunit [Verrucomicrobiales bacterium]|nr:efflux transporter periplasmic adaptor subunit [Verrucomicrobiales bacterium]|tara:strand:+ start:1214 stop:3178 length:1965 start_codon:yes stop_codon:yes gene_type:complete
MKSKLLLIPFIAIALGIGFVVGRKSGSSGSPNANPTASAPESDVKFWTCSMHPPPAVKESKPGKCKICVMDLIPVRDDDSASLGPREVKLTDAAAKLAEVEVAPVERRMPVMNVRMVGKIDYDETRLAYITARFPGRLDRLYVDYTGVSVKTNDHLFALYSPDLLAAQQELIQAAKALRDMGEAAPPIMRERGEITLQSAREKLRLWDLKSDQIAAIEKSEKPSERLTVYAPISGVVIDKKAVEGMYVETGARIYTIADLSQVWVKFDAYESDLQWLHFGQEVTFETEAYPGRVFAGRISFIDPVLNSKTRTVKVRVNVENADGLLKPDMFVRGAVQSRIASGGRVMDAFYAGKWISPMHPEIVTDNPGDCPKCGMKLVSAESLGYASAEGNTNAPLVIPVSAPLITGKRAVVYVATKDKPGIYAGREVTLGPRAGDAYVVEEGLKEGELIVVNGAFKIDSAVQIAAKPSMMAGTKEAGRGAEGVHDHASADEEIEKLPAPAEFVTHLRTAVDAYSAVGSALDSDKLADKSSVAALRDSVGKIDATALEELSAKKWKEDLREISSGLAGIEKASDIDAARADFEHISVGLIRASKRFGVTGVFQFHCPMAFDNKGASWLQLSDQIRNPYFGASMLKCGSMKWRGDGAKMKKGAP